MVKTSFPRRTSFVMLEHCTAPSAGDLSAIGFASVCLTGIYSAFIRYSYLSTTINATRTHTPGSSLLGFSGVVVVVVCLFFAIERRDVRPLVWGWQRPARPGCCLVFSKKPESPRIDSR
ncbi:hypothetical protein FN846DRAFT_966185 [Sphaerosporella brunnea]|uniref:Uncharacterized protein n=1 Tax=Sphaerosporella brunnea TaxID=1250544 RepID=A0A5J5EKI1_9PEZI|nr:hypothetical protein FN846DRAFT_966185 [Sphaerosporella brunnea]